MKQHIAIWMPGGVGGGYYSQGIPVISKLVNDLSTDFSISIYSLHPPNKNFEAKGYSIFSINRKIKKNWLRWLFLACLFLKHHYSKKYSALYAFWGFPGGFLVALLSWLLNKPSIVHLQGGDAVYITSINYGSLKGFNKKLMQWAYNRCTLLIALTHFQKNKLIEMGVVRSIEVIPFGPDLDLFKVKKQFEIHQPVRFLHVGNLLPVKDQITLLNAFALLRQDIDCELRIIGEDHLQGAIQSYCRQLNLENRIKFIGIQTYHDMSPHYLWADVLMVTSLYEGQCLAVSEAAASGVMIAGTRTGILSDWGDQCAVITDVKEAERLASNILRALRNPTIKNELIRKARSKVEIQNSRWTYEKIRDHMNRLITIG